MSHFNDEAATWDNAEIVETMKVLASRALEVLSLDKGLDIMDFGCGTGLFGLEFSDYAKTLTGVDTSEGMLEVFNKKTQGHKEIQSILMDLETEELDRQFDLIVSSMTFHHLDHPAKMLAKFEPMLRDGGAIAIVDLDKEDGSFHPDNKGMGVKHLGFSQEEVNEWLRGTSFKLKHQIVNEISKNDKTYGQFLAVFTKG